RRHLHTLGVRCGRTERCSSTARRSHGPSHRDSGSRGDVHVVRKDSHPGAARAVPELATELSALEAKLIDLHPVVKNCVYHPDFSGSFSLKYILTPLVPELTYSDLVIVDGRVASVEIARLLFVADKIPRQERDRVRQDLLNYCERDTWAMVK